MILSFDGTGVPEIEVQVELWRKRSGVRFQVETQGEPAEGYQISGITTTPGEITVAGTDEALEELKQQGNIITIPQNSYRWRESAAIQNLQISGSAICCRRIRCSHPMSVKRSLFRWRCCRWAVRNSDLDVDQIVTNNLGSNLTVSYSSAELAIRVQGTEQDLEELQVSDISASIDLAGKTAGDYTVPVEIVLPAGYELVEDVTIAVQLRE